MSNQLDSFYQEFERATVEFIQSAEVVLVSTEDLACHFPQAGVWVMPLNKMIKALRMYPKKDELYQRFPEYREQLQGPIMEVVIVGNAVAETLPAQARTRMYGFLDSCRRTLQGLAS